MKKKKKKKERNYVFFKYSINTRIRTRNNINNYYRKRGESFPRYVTGVDAVDEPRLLKSSRFNNTAIRFQRCSRSSYSS